MMNELWLRVKALLLRRRFDRDLEDEVAFHLAMREEKSRSEVNAGDKAREAALRQFGNATRTREEMRRMRSFIGLESFFHDVAYGARLLRRSPLFTLVAVTTLALGIGANTAIFSLTYQILLRRLPVPHPEELTVLRSPGPKQGRTSSDGDGAASFSYPMYKDVRARSGRVFSGLLARTAVALSVSGLGSTERAQGELVSGNYFEVLGVAPALGRVFSMQDESAAGANPVCVLSYGYWARHFGNDPSVLNKQVNANGMPLTVVGVSQPGFSGVQIGNLPDIFIPITMKEQMTPNADKMEDRRYHWAAVIGRLHPGLTREGAETALQAVFHPLLEAEVPLERIPDSQQPQFLARKLLLEEGSHGRPILQRNARQPLVILTAMVGLILLIACANLAGLLVARGETRQREIALRLSLGASRQRVFRQLLTENLLLAFAGGAAGLALAPLLLRTTMRAFPENIGLSGLHAGLDQRLLLFALGLALVTTLLFGLMPALRLVRADVQGSLRQQSSLLEGEASGVGIRKALMTLQVVLATVLLAVAGLFTQSLINIQSVNLGMNPDHVIEFSIAPELSGYTLASTVAVVEQLRKAIAPLPGVRSVSAAETPVLHNSASSGGMTVEGYSPGENEEEVRALENWIGPEYFSTMNIPLLSGREFRETDKAGSPQVAIINETLARRYFARRDPLGKHIVFRQGNVRPDIEIVGIVQDSKHDNPRGRVSPFAYMPYAQYAELGHVTFYIRTGQAPLSMGNALRATVARLAPGVPTFNLMTLNQRRDESISADRLLAWLCLWLGGLAAMLAALGLYGVTAYMVARRTREIGIRMALGATRDGVAWLVLGEVLRLTALGLAVGLCAAVLTGKLIESQLFGVKGWSPLVLGLTAILLAATALVAGSLPARRAARIQPMVALRYE